METVKGIIEVILMTIGLVTMFGLFIGIVPLIVRLFFSIGDRLFD